MWQAYQGHHYLMSQQLRYTHTEETCNSYPSTSVQKYVHQKEWHHHAVDVYTPTF